MKRTDLAYIAGIIDGEGCIRAQIWESKNKLARYNTIVTVEMVDKTPLQFIQNLFGGRINKHTSKISERKLRWRWQVTGKEAEQLLVAVKPYLLTKKAQAEIGLRVLRDHPRYQRYTPMERFLQEADAKAIKELNK